MKKSKPLKTLIDTKKKTVDGYIKLLNPEQQKICRRLRELITGAVPGIEEGIKWNMPFYSFSGMVCYIAAHASHVNLGFYKGREIPDPLRLLTGSGQNLRHMKIRRAEDIPETSVVILIRKAVELNFRA